MAIGLAAAVIWAAPGAAKKPWHCTFSVSPQAGVSKTHRSGDRFGLGQNRISDGSSSRSTTRTIERNMKWEATVRFRGDEKPKLVEVKIAYIVYRGAATEPVVLKQETKPIKLDDNGKAIIEFESPTTRLTKTRTTGARAGNNGFISSKSNTSGERIAGCIAQLYADGVIEKVYVSDSRWEAAAKAGPITTEALRAKRTNTL